MAENKPKKRHLFLKIIGIIACLWLVVLVAIQIVLTPAVLQKVIDRFAVEFIDGELHFKNSDISVVKSFPNLSVTIDTLSITYPSDMFPQPASGNVSANGTGTGNGTVRGTTNGNARGTTTGTTTHAASYQQEGRGAQRDTLISFNRLSASVNILSLIRKGSLKVPHVSLRGPRVFYHSYDDTLSNLRVLKFLSDTTKVEEEDTTDFQMPSIIIGKIALEDSPHIVYTSLTDTLDARLAMKSMVFGSDIDIKELANLRLDRILVKLDSIGVNGSWGSDRLNFMLENFYLKGSDSLFTVSLSANAKAYTEAFGYLRVPLKAEGQVSFPEEGNFTNVNIIRLKASLADIPLAVKGRVNIKSSDEIYVNANASVSSFKIQPILQNMPELLPVSPSNISHKATLGLDITAKGTYSPRSLPDVNASMRLQHISVRSPKDSIMIYLDSLGLSAKTRRAAEGDHIDAGEKIFDLKAGIDTIYFDYKSQAFVSGKDLGFEAQASQRLMNESLSQTVANVVPMFGEVSIGGLVLQDSNDMAVHLRGSQNSFSLLPKTENRKIPVLSLESDTRGIALRSDIGRGFVRSLKIDAVAAMNSLERRQRISRVLDSLAAAHPGEPADSLFKYLPRRYSSGGEATSEYFRSKDITLDFGEAFKRYYREWDFGGDVAFGSFRVMTPLFPLRTRVEDASLSVDNNTVSLNSFNLFAGKSDLKTRGSVKGLRRMLLSGRGVVALDLEVQTDSLDVNELWTAYNLGQKSEFWGSEVSDEEIEARLEQSVEAADSVSVDFGKDNAIILPGNVSADIRLDGSNIRYDSAVVDGIHTHVVLKDRKAQILGTSINTSLGAIGMDACYSSADIHDLTAGVVVSLSEVEVAKVLELMPQIDTIMPVLRNFNGRISLDAAARTTLDTLGNFVTKNTDGVLSISGKNLTLQDTETFEKILKLLKFQKPDELKVPYLKANAIVENGRVEVRPFALSIDRYKAILNGAQNFVTTNMDYHISVIESPLVFKVGAKVYGLMDDIKFKLEAPRYKKESKIPSSEHEVQKKVDEVYEYIHSVIE